MTNGSIGNEYAPRVSIASAIRIAYACALAGIPCGWISSPGVGKSSFVAQIAAALGRAFATLLGTTLTDVDVGGIKYLGPDGRVHSEPIAQLRTALTRGTIVLIDEVASAHATVRAALLDLLATGRVDGLPIHPESALIVCYNPPDECPSGEPLEAAFRNRLPVVEIVPEKREVSAYFRRVGAGQPILGVDLPAIDSTGAREAWIPLAAEFAAVSEIRSDLIDLAPSVASVTDGHAWANGRAWEIGLKGLGALRLVHAAIPVPSDPAAAAAHVAQCHAEERALLAGVVTRERASTYLGILRWQGQIPDPADIVRDPLAALVPTEVDGQLAAVSAVLAAARGGDTWTGDAWAAYVYARRLRPEIAASVGASLDTLAIPPRGTSPHEAAGREAMDRLEGDASARAAREASYRAADSARGAA